MRISFVFSLLLLIAFSAEGQIEYFVTANVNLYTPEGTDAKGMYPIVGYKKDTDPKFLVGGFGAGFAALKEISEKLRVKGEITLSKHAYWESAVLVDNHNVRIGEYSYGTLEYALHVVPSIQYSVSKKILIGTGVGAYVPVYSHSRVPSTTSGDSRDYVRNRFYRVVTPIIPLEISFKSERKLYSIRVEQSLGSRYKKSLASIGKEHFAIVSFSVGFKVGK